MIKQIYKITKPSDPLFIYIGSTLLYLNLRFRAHINSKLYNQIDISCNIELIEEIEGNTRADFEDIEFEWILFYKNLGYNVINNNTGKSKEKDYRKNLISTKYHRTKHNKEKNKEYNNWCSDICRKAKKEGLTSKEYRLKYSIPDYSKLKKS